MSKFNDADHVNHPSKLVANTPRRSLRVAQMMKRGSSTLGDESKSSSLGNVLWRTTTKKQRTLKATNGNSESSQTPQFTFGVIADIQYAPVRDGYSFGGAPRYYRHALMAAQHAAGHFQKDKVSLVLNLGDIIDGKCQYIAEHGGDKVPEGMDPGLAALEEVVTALSTYQSGPILHTYGNHELYNMDRHVIGQKLDIPFVKEPCGDLVGYRTHVHNSIRFVVLDTYDISRMRRCPKSSRKYKEATRILTDRNPNFPDEENSSRGLVRSQSQFVAFNGAVDKPQLEWLKETLRQAREEQQKVIVVSHQPILPGSSSPVCLVWNYQEVLDVLRQYNDTVVLSLSGHAHKGGYKRDTKSGIHFRVIEAALESPSPIKTYGLVDVYDDRLVIRGFGDCRSGEYDFGHMQTVMEPYIQWSEGSFSNKEVTK